MAMLKGTASPEQVASFVSLEEMALELATARGAQAFFSSEKTGYVEFFLGCETHFFGFFC